MKHGDKAKSKKASKASGTKSSRKADASSKSVKASPSKKGVAQKISKESSSKAGGNGKARPAITAGPGFSNPVVANAFKRAVKKYPNAFRKLTD